MKSSFLFFFLLINTYLFTQEDTVFTFNIQVNEKLVFKGIDEKVQDWYIFIEGGIFYLANLYMSENEILAWFEKRKDSQNIYKSNSEVNYEWPFYFMKEDDVEDFFYVSLRLNKNELIMNVINDKTEFKFEKINIQE